MARESTNPSLRGVALAVVFGAFLLTGYTLWIVLRPVVWKLYGEYMYRPALANDAAAGTLQAKIGTPGEETSIPPVRLGKQQQQQQGKQRDTAPTATTSTKRAAVAAAPKQLLQVDRRAARALLAAA